MAELQLLYVWGLARLRSLLRQEDRDDGFGALEWVVGAAIVIAAAIIIYTVLTNKGKTKANTVNLQ
jgi:hypothetical protein